MNLTADTAGILHRPGAGFLCDDGGTIPYSSIPEIMAATDLYFNDCGKKNMFCLAVLADNTVAQAILVLYLLTQKVNFLLMGNYPQTGQKIPAFCDYILKISSRPAQELQLPADIELTVNPGYIGGPGPCDLERHSRSVLFMSSGTTGEPKYIQFKQKKLFGNAHNCIRRLAIDRRCRVLIPVPVHHMYGMGVGLLPALLSGASICLIQKNNIIKLLDKIAGFKPDLTLLTPTLVKMILLSKQKIDRQGIYVSAGEKLAGGPFADFESRYGELLNLYGCTELGAVAVSPGGSAHSRSRAEGLVMPLKKVAIKISRKENGQIYCRHPAGFEGYLDKRGFRLPLSPTQQTWHATKDTGVRIGRTGFAVTGRSDNCINRSGFLVSLDEIASFLENLVPEINKAIVFEGKSDGLLAKLIAVCELTNGCSLDPAELKRLCKAKTQRHLVPDEFFFVREIPRLNNGKPDRALLADICRLTIK